MARDPAFNFIYRENIARLAELGHITYFSPVYGSDLRKQIYCIFRGYPELFARQLHRRKKLMEAIKTFCRGRREGIGGMWRNDVPDPLTYGASGERPMLWRASCHWTVQWWELGCIWGIVG